MRRSNLLFCLLLSALLIIPGLAGAAWWPKSKPYYNKEYSNYQTMWVNADALNVRSCPDSHCRVETILYRGNTAKLVGQKGGWYKLLLSNGNKGWASASYLSSSPVARYVPETETQNDAVVEPVVKPKSNRDENVLYLDELTEIEDVQRPKADPDDVNDIFN